MFYYAFVYPTISYGILAWGGYTMVYNCAAAHRLHDKIIKNLFRLHFPRHSSLQIRQVLKILDIRQLYVYTLMEFYFCIRHYNAYPHLHLNIQEHTLSRYNLRHITDLEVPFPRTNSILASYKYQIPYLWNLLPSNLKVITSKKKFKESLKSHIISDP